MPLLTPTVESSTWCYSTFSFALKDRQSSLRRSHQLHSSFRIVQLMSPKGILSTLDSKVWAARLLADRLCACLAICVLAFFSLRIGDTRR